MFTMSVTAETHTIVFLLHQPENTKFFQYCSSTLVQHMPCTHPCIFYSKDLFEYPCSPRLNQLPTRSVEKMNTKNRGTQRLKLLKRKLKGTYRKFTLLLRRNNGHWTNLKLPALLGIDSKSISLNKNNCLQKLIPFI